jgi:hypothetical protein
MRIVHTISITACCLRVKSLVCCAAGNCAVPQSAVPKAWQSRCAAAAGPPQRWLMTASPEAQALLRQTVDAMYGRDEIATAGHS